MRDRAKNATAKRLDTPHLRHVPPAPTAPAGRSLWGLGGWRGTYDPGADRALVEACLRGDEEAWAALIAKYKNLIYSIPLKYGGSPEDAADVFQAVCVELFNELPRLRKKDRLRAWLITVTAHQAFHWKRRRRRRMQFEQEGLDPERLPATASSPVPALELEREQRIREAISQLPARCREMVRMLFYEQPALPYAEVAKRLGLATGSIGFIRGRCLRRLQSVLEELGF